MYSETPQLEPIVPAYHLRMLSDEQLAEAIVQALDFEVDHIAINPHCTGGRQFDREPGDVQFDEESGEGDSLAVERDFDLARAAKNQQVVEEIDAALKRIDDGTYGVCEYSGKNIPKERLIAIPWARERVEYKTSRFR